MFLKRICNIINLWNIQFDWMLPLQVQWNGKEVMPMKAREDLIKLLLIIILLQLFAILALIIK
ncbi:hypothetical protein EGP99_02290 [bacterium]|nr:hypothetical protein [bacterium]